MEPWWYQPFVFWISLEIAIFAWWLTAMLTLRSRRTHDWSPENVSSILYVLSSAMVFTLIAGRNAYEWPWEYAFVALTIKAIACTAITLFAYLKMRKEVF